EAVTGTHQASPVGDDALALLVAAAPAAIHDATCGNGRPRPGAVAGALARAVPAIDTARRPLIVLCSVENVGVVAEFVRIRRLGKPNSHEFGYDIYWPREGFQQSNPA